MRASTPSWERTHGDDHATIAFRDRGCGAPVILLHGTGLTAAVWRAIGYDETLSAFRTVAIDLRGHGRSEKPTTPVAYSASRIAGDAVAVLDALRIPAAHIVGYSLGARIGYSLAAEHPSRVLSLTSLGGTYAHARGDVDDFFFPGWRAALEAGTMKDFVAQWQISSDFRVSSATALAIRRNEPIVLKALLEAIDSDEGVNDDDIAAIAAPTLLIAGESDGPRWRASLRAHALIAGSRFLGLPSTDHIDTLQHPRVAAAIRSFIRSQSDP